MSRGLRAVFGTALVVVGAVTQQGYLVSAGAAMALGAVFEQQPPAFRRSTGQTIMVRSGTEPQPIIYGRAKKSGPLLWFGTSGDLRQYLWYAVAVCDYREIDGYQTLWIDGTAVDIATQFDVDGFCTHPAFVDSAGNKLVKAKFYRGAPGQTFDAELVASHPDLANTAVGTNTAYFWVRFETDRSEGGNDPDTPNANVWALGAPRNLQVTVRGFRVYDPRKDSTAGGVGAHRVADPATWEWSDNPALCIRDWLADGDLGPGFRLSALPTDHYAAQANICDELVTVPDGLGGTVTQNRYTINGFDTLDSEDLTPYLRSMMTSCYGSYVQFQGKYLVTAGAWKTPDSDIDETWLADGYVLEPSATGEELYNIVAGQHPDVRKAYVLVDYPARESAAFITADGGRPWPRQHDLVWTTDTYEAQRHALTKLKHGRNQAQIRLECNRKAMRLAPFDTVRLSINVLGWTLKTFRVMHMALGANGLIEVTLREESATDWDFTLPEIDAVSYGDPIAREAGRPPPIAALSATSAPEGIRLEWFAGAFTDGRTEIYASATNDRSTAVLVARETSETITLPYAAATVRYFWGFNRGTNNLLSVWHPAGALDGVMGTAGAAGQGPAGADGDPAIDGLVAIDGPAAWVRGQDGSTWDPVATTTDLDWTFALAGVAVARLSRRVTRSSAGLLTVSTVAHPAGDLNPTRVTITVTGAGTRAVTLSAKYDHEGRVKTATQTVTSTLSGADGADGADGAPAQYVVITGEQAFKFAAGAGVPTPTSVTLTAALFGGLSGFDWEYWTGSAWANLSGTNTNSSYALAYNNVAWGAANALRVRCLSGAAWDEVTVVKLFDGATGDPGDPGVNARVALLSNETHAVPANADGSSPIFTGSGTLISAYSGITQLQYEAGTGFPTTSGRFRVTLAASGVTAGAVSVSGLNASVANISAMAGDTGSITYTINTRADGVNTALTKAQTFSKAKRGTDGASGVNGRRTAILDMYRWSAAAPTTFPAGDSTYTWATGQFTAPATLNGWSLTPPAPVAGQTLYIVRQVYADTNTSSTSSVTWAATTSMPLSVAGTDGATGDPGAAGQRYGLLEMYRWSAAAPTTFPAGDSTYTWATGAFTAPSTPNGWSLTPGAVVPGQTLWGISVVVSNNLTTTTTVKSWNSTTVYPVGFAGTDGADGDPAIDGWVDIDGPAAWVRSTNGTTWSPTATTTDLDWTFALAGVAVARLSRRITRSSAGLLTISTVTHPSGDLNTARVTITTTGGGTAAITVKADYNFGGKTKSVSQAVLAALSGADAGAGLVVETVVVTSATNIVTAAGHVSVGGQIALALRASHNNTGSNSSPWGYSTALQRKPNAGSTWTTLRTYTSAHPDVIVSHEFLSGSSYANAMDLQSSFIDTPGSGTWDYRINVTSAPAGTGTTWTLKIATQEIK